MKAPLHPAPCALHIVLAFLCLAVVAVPACTIERYVPPTTVILVRHAEKMVSGDEAGANMFDPADPGLTEAGMERARELAHVLGETGIDAIYATQFARTKLTARPLAELLGIQVREVTAGAADYADRMAAIIRDEHPGDVVLVVGHSNTGPAVIEALGAKPVPVIDDDEYDDLYFVKLGGSGAPVLLSLRFGRETP